MHLLPVLLWFAAFVGAGAVVFGARSQRVKRVTPNAEARLPAANAVDWNIARESGAPQLPEGAAWASIDAGIATLPLLEAAHEINPVVVESLSRWVNHGEMMNAPTLFQYVTDHHEAIFSAHSDLGFLHALEGYVGEAFARDDLMAAHHDVFMPDATNVPGWDLNVDGHLMQVKVGQDALQHAHQALAEHPEFHIITDPVTAHALDHAVGLQDLAPDHLEAVTEHTLQGADALANAGSFHFPIVTAIRSSIREIGLLSDGHTDVESALKNAGLDVAGAGGGLMAGAKGGALAGMWFGPHGAAIGAIIGGIAGAIGGRTITNSIKRAALDKALADYQIGRARATARIEQLQLSTQSQVREEITRADRNLRAYYSGEQNRFAIALAAHDSKVTHTVHDIADDFAQLLRRLRDDLHAGLARFTEAQSFSRLRYLLWPRDQDIAVIRAREWVEQQDQVIAEALERVAELKTDQSEDGRRVLIDYVAKFTSENPFDARQLAASIRERAAVVQDCEKNATELRDRLVLTLTEYTVKIKHAVDVKVAEAFVELSRDIQSAVDRCKKLNEKVKVEAAKLGMNLSG